MKLHTSGLCVSATISWKLSSYISTAMQFHSISLCTISNGYVIFFSPV